MKPFPSTRSAWLRALAPLALLGAGIAGWLAWTPGQVLRSGAHDLGTNGVWLGHGWLADDQWFMRSPERAMQLTTYHNTPSVLATLQDLKNKGMADVFLDLHPCTVDGRLPPTSHSGTETLALLARDLEIRPWPWVGGNRGETCFPEKPAWRRAFVADCRDLLTKCPQLSGVLVDIEPWPEDDPAMLALLDELRQAMPPGKQVAVAACPPPTWFQPDRNGHWGEAYFRRVAAKSDLMVVMMYDTGLSNDKLFVHLVKSWTDESLRWAAPTPVLLGVADYQEDPPQPWHHPQTETLGHALAGVHAGLSSFEALPANYRGVAVFADYTLNAEQWALWEREFCAKRAKIAIQKATSLEDLMGAMQSPKNQPPPPGNRPPRQPKARPPIPYRNP